MNMNPCRSQNIQFHPYLMDNRGIHRIFYHYSIEMYTRKRSHRLNSRTINNTNVAFHSKWIKVFDSNYIPRVHTVNNVITPFWIWNTLIWIMTRNFILFTFIKRICDIYWAQTIYKGCKSWIWSWLEKENELCAILCKNKILER